MNKRIDLWHENGHVRARFSFSFPMIDVLRNLPLPDRKFDNDSKTWGFAPHHLDYVVEAAHRMFETVYVWPAGQMPPPPGSKSKRKPRTQRQDPTDEMIVDFVRFLPREAMTAAYRKAASILHPDHGGNADDMRRLNHFWEMLEQELYTPRR